ncbi:hypothetical protein [Actinocorallia aurea]
MPGRTGDGTVFALFAGASASPSAGPGPRGATAPTQPTSNTIVVHIGMPTLADVAASPTP